MGLFSSRKKTVIQSTAQRMLQDKDFKHSHSQALSQYIWEKGDSLNIDLDAKSLSDYMIEAYQRSLPKQFEKAYHYAKKPNKYLYGLPTSSVVLDIEEQMQKLLMQELSITADDIIDLFIDGKDYFMTIWETLVREYDYDSQTNELKKLSQHIGYPCYLLDCQLQLREENLEASTDGLSFNYNQTSERSKDYEREETIPILSSDETESCIVYFTYTYHNPRNNSEMQIESEIHLDLADINPKEQENQTIKKESEYLYCTYIKEGKEHWFSYELFSGGLPNIDTGFTATTSIGEFYPRLYIRLNQTDVVDNKDQQAKKGIRRLYKKLGLNPKEVRDIIRTNIGNDYHDVRGMYLFAGVAINQATGDKVIAEYSYRYFKRLYDIHGATGLTQVIEDNASKQTLSYSSMAYQEFDGVKGDLKVGEAILEHQEIILRRKRMFRRAKKGVNHLLYFQLSETKYACLTLVGLKQYVWQSGYGADHIGADENLVIPIDRLLLKDLTKKEKEIFMHKSFHCQMMFVKIIKKKWYQTSLFKVVLAVVAIGLTWAFAPAGTTLSTLLKTMAINTAKAMAISYATNIIITELVRAGVISEKHAGILQLVVSIGIMAYGVGFDMSKTLTAPNIMKSVNSVFQFYNKQLELQARDIQKQMQALNNWVSSNQAKIQEVQKLLDTKVFTPSQELLRSSYTPTVDLFETVEMFYDRHNSFDVVGLSHGLISDYVQGANQLRPQLYHTQNELDDVLLT